MTEPAGAQRRLAERLKDLRTQGRGVGLTQQQLASALGASVPLVSSWENAVAVPPEERLKSYALFFCRGHGRDPVLPEESELTDEEEATRRRLIDELGALRDQALWATGTSSRQTGALGGRFWHFPDGAPIRIITTKMWPSVLNDIPYANPRHPNYIESYADADRDATIELFGHVRAENPTADVRFLTADRVQQDDLSGHVVILGQADRLLYQTQRPEDSERPQVPLVQYLNDRLEIPVGTRIPVSGDTDFDSEYVVTFDAEGRPAWYGPGEVPHDTRSYPPRFVRDPSSARAERLVEEGLPVLEYDVALLARVKNQLNLTTTVTICAGIFSRGTFGAVRAMTDASLRSRNEHVLAEQFEGLSDFCLLFYVPVLRVNERMETLTPDLGRPFHRLLGWRHRPRFGPQ